MNRILLALPAVVLASALNMNSAARADLIFAPITSNSPVIPSGQIFAEVVDASTPGNPAAEFIFHNNVGLASSVTGVYVSDAGGVLSLLQGLLGAGDVSFSTGNSSPSHLPAANDAVPPFAGDPSLGAQADSGSGGLVNHGIDEAADSLALTYSLSPGEGHADVLAALAGGTLRFGLHIQSIGGGGSDSYVSVASGGGMIEVPEPATWALAATGLAFFAWRPRRLCHLPSERRT